MDLSACDTVMMGLLTCTPLPLRKVLADLDDRIRMPNYNGAIHVGFDGLLAIVAVPMLCAIAMRGPLCATLVFAALLPMLTLLHHASLRARRRSRFFAAWAVVSFVYVRVATALFRARALPFGASLHVVPPHAG